ncbi:MAG: glutamate racemase [Nitrososphaeraceae archaeon]
MSNTPIMVFDSGIGSMSIIKELRRELPNENILYFADRANFPYGNKSHKRLLEIMKNTIKYLERFKPKIIIIASNTPSLQILDEIKDKVNVPILGVRPPLRESVKLTKNNHIGIMATESAINSKEIDKQINDEIPQKIFVNKYNASPLIALIENGDFIKSRKKIRKQIHRILGNIEDIDVITLSSTHLPFILDQLSEEFPSVKFIDSAKTTAKNVKQILTDNGLRNKNNTGRMRILVSDGKKEFQEMLRYLGIKENVQEVFWSI